MNNNNINSPDPVILDGDQADSIRSYMIFHQVDAEHAQVVGKLSISYIGMIQGSDLNNVLSKANNDNPEYKIMNVRNTTVGDIIFGSYKQTEGYYKIHDNGFELMCLAEDRPE